MKYIIGVDLGGTKISIALLNRNTDIISQIVLSTESNKGVDYMLTKISKSIFKLIKDQGLNKTDILGVGFGSPGPLDIKRGIVHFAPNLKYFHNVHLKNRLKKKLKIPVFFENDANLAAIGEQRKGAGRNVKDFLCITLGTGVGGGLILNGKLYRGTEDGAGEVGYMIVEPNKPEIYLEKYSSATAIVNHFKKALKNGEKTSLKKEITSKNIYESALKGDRLSKKIMIQAGKYLGIALATIVNLLNLEMIIIGGHVAEAGEMILKPAREELKKRAIYPANKVKVVRAKLGTNSGVTGAALLVLDSL